MLLFIPIFIPIFIPVGLIKRSYRKLKLLFRRQHARTEAPTKLAG